MTLPHMLLAALVAIVWGFAFVVIKVGLESFSAPQLTALRFLVACLPVFLVPRPAMPWPSLILIGLTLFAGQFLLLFFAFTLGLPAGLASVVQQFQAFFTVLLAALFLRDVPSRRQVAGMIIAFAGLAVIGVTIGGDVTLVALALGLASAFSWAIGNVLVKRSGEVPILSLVVWASLVPPVPALLVSTLHDERGTILDALAAASWLSLGAVAYLGLVATALAYAIWGGLLRRYSTAAVAPFALLAPCTGVLSAALLLEEVFGAARYAGMALILAGLAVIILPAGVARRSVRGADRR